MDARKEALRLLLRAETDGVFVNLLLPERNEGDARERALLTAIARDHSQSVFGVAVTRLFALEKRLGEAQSLEPLLDECLRTSMSIDDRRERAIAERDATQAALEEAEAKLTRLSRLAELQSFVQEVQRLQAELEAQKQENARLTEELDALKRIDLEN